MVAFQRFTLPVCMFVSLVSGTPAFAGCGAGSYKGIFGKCWPEIGGSAGQATEQVKNEIKAQTLGPVLETWINQSERTSSAGAQPIPLNIRQALAGYIDDDSMNRARFKIGDAGALNLAGLTVKYGDVVGGDVSAVTLNDVIVFRNADDAYNNPALWAHELTHVGQYQSRGVRGFAIAYMRRPWDMEGPAYQKGDNFLAWYQNKLPAEQLAQATQTPDTSDSDDADSNNEDAGQSPPKFYWVGISWNHHGDFSVRTGNNPDEAQRLALQSCNTNPSSSSCYSGPVVPGDRLMCYAIVRDGFDLYSSITPEKQSSANDAMSACQNGGDPGPGCQIAQLSCNDSL